MTPFRKTSDGILVTRGTVESVFWIIGVIGAIGGGVIAAVRFVDAKLDTPTRTEFVEHMRRDSSLHRDQWAHENQQDSSIAQAVRDNHATACYIAHNPMPLCRDQLGAMQAGAPRRVP